MITNKKCIFIATIKNEAGTWLEPRNDIGEFICEQFSMLFKANNITNCPCLLDYIHPCISPSENESLLTIPAHAEILQVLNSFNPSKSPCLDGMTSSFFQTHWHIVGNDVTKVIQNTFISGRISRAINRTFVILIPKVNQISCFNHIHPIGLCNKVYKIISKLLALRLKPLLPKLISPNQAAFIPGRWIGKNSLLVNEILHHMKKKKGKKGLLAINVDLHKAFDRVDWRVLSNILSHFGFSAKVISLLHQCFAVESVEILLNGSVVGSITLERDIWQGDPLFPFLFIIFMELLSRMLYKDEEDGKINCIKISRTSLPISHLLFSDDIMLFCRADKDNANQIARCLELFCCWTGQAINFPKSGCLFSKNTSPSCKANIKHILNMKDLPKDIKYLGNPLFPGRNNIKGFSDILKKIDLKLQSWKAKLIS